MVKRVQVDADSLPMNMNVLITELRKVKDELDELSKRKSELNETQDNIKGVLLDRMAEENVDSIKTQHGTVYRTEKKFWQIKDFSALCEYVKRTGHFEIFQKRVAPSAVDDIMASEDEAPAGLDSYEKWELGFRRK